MSEGKHQRWVVGYPLTQTLEQLREQHNAGIDALEAAEAEIERMAEHMANSPRADVYAAVCRERDNLREKLAAVEKSMEELRMYNRDLASAAIAEPSTPRPVRVRFDCTAEWLNEQIEWAVSEADRGNDLLGCYAEIMSNLATRAVVDVPEGVQPTTSVDPKLCEDPFSSTYADPEDEDDFAFDITAFSDCAEPQISGEVARLSAQTCHDAGMWLLSFAASKGIDVRLPVKPSEPPASAETLEQLAEVGMAELTAFWFKAKKFDNLHPDYQRDMIRFVTAILQAAKPEIHYEQVRVAFKECKSPREWADYINSRIRYGVELPPSEPAQKCDSCGAPRHTHRLCRWCGKYGEHEGLTCLACKRVPPADSQPSDLKRQQRECYERVYAAALTGHARIDDNFTEAEWEILESTAKCIALEAARTLPTRLAELDAALEGE